MLTTSKTYQENLKHQYYHLSNWKCNAIKWFIKRNNVCLQYYWLNCWTHKNNIFKRKNKDDNCKQKNSQIKLFTDDWDCVQSYTFLFRSSSICSCFCHSMKKWCKMYCKTRNITCLFTSRVDPWRDDNDRHCTAKYHVLRSLLSLSFVDLRKMIFFKHFVRLHLPSVTCLEFHYWQETFYHFLDKQGSLQSLQAAINMKIKLFLFSQITTLHAHVMKVQANGHKIYI